MEKSLLLETYLKQLRLPAICRQYQEVARQATQGNLPYEAFLLALVELETQQREENAHRKRLRLARFPVIKTLDQFDFTCIPSINKAKVLALAQGEYLDRRGYPAGVLAAIAEPLALEILRDVRLTDAHDWQDLLTAYSGIDDELILGALKKR